MSTTGWIVLGVANIPLYVVLGWLFFNDLGHFVDAIRSWFTPVEVSALRGEYHEDRWASFKLALWLLACAACVFGQAQAIATYWK